ncbi:MAG: YidC/Oxa1 family membrane protein insertase [Candidatus Eremiobacteraeota bacterium]|nr:YidC/Oxa1 family membrane protein insertase [Candidatus Eremiobacteraeota bacterium]
MRYLKMGTLLLIALCIAISTCWAQDKASKLTPEDKKSQQQEAVPLSEVTAGLNKIQGLSKEEAEEKAFALQKQEEKASWERKRIIRLLRAAALEKAGERDKAIATYKNIVKVAKDTPYAVTANFRLHVIENPDRTSKEMKAVYKIIAGETEAKGWFLLSGKWVWSTTHNAALQSLIDMQSSRLSFRFFQYLRSKSPFPKDYAYMFVLLVLTIGTRLIALPLYFNAAKASNKISHLQPELEMIQDMYGDDPGLAQQETMKLYDENGIKVWSGCLTTLIDLIFVVWAMISLGNYSPQMILDGSRFFWISDVTQFNLLIIVAWIFLSIIQTGLNPVRMSCAQITCSSLFFGAIIAGIAWWWKWPAYVFIFWISMIVVGTLTMGILRIICSATD